MAKYSDKNPNNIEGNFFVDNHCIGCMSCESFDWHTFVLKDGKAYVYAQPNDEAFERAAIAMLSCPVDAIGVQKNKEHVRAIKKKLPVKLNEDVYFCSYNSKEAIGANSYLIIKEKGNILVDCPKFTKALLEKIEHLGGIKYIYLTHVDDIGEYLKFKEHFHAKVIFHEDDFSSRIKTADIVLKGKEDYILDEHSRIIPVPGHTKGHTVLLHKGKYLFTGDHLAYKNKEGYLYMFERFCWYDWNTQLHSLKKLLEYDFSHIYAGHGGSFDSTVQEVKIQIKNFLKRKNFIE